jgi:hypothetical protein
MSTALTVSDGLVLQLGTLPMTGAVATVGRAVRNRTCGEYERQRARKDGQT